MVENLFYIAVGPQTATHIEQADQQTNGGDPAIGLQSGSFRETSLPAVPINQKLLKIYSLDLSDEHFLQSPEIRVLIPAWNQENDLNRRIGLFDVSYYLNQLSRPKKFHVTLELDVLQTQWLRSIFGEDLIDSGKSPDGTMVSTLEFDPERMTPSQREKLKTFYSSFENLAHDPATILFTYGLGFLNLYFFVKTQLDKAVQEDDQTLAHLKPSIKFDFGLTALKINSHGIYSWSSSEENTLYTPTLGPSIGIEINYPSGFFMRPNVTGTLGVGLGSEYFNGESVGALHFGLFLAGGVGIDLGWQSDQYQIYFPTRIQLIGVQTTAIGLSGMSVDWLGMGINLWRKNYPNLNIELTVSEFYLPDDKKDEKIFDDGHALNLRLVYPLELSQLFSSSKKDPPPIPSIQPAWSPMPTERPTTHPATPKSPIPMANIDHQQIIINQKTHFDFNRVEIRPESYSILDAVVTLLSEHPEIRLIQIQGHTDDIGTDNYNQVLSQQRANEVLNYFVSRGVDASRLRATGFGRSRPLTTGTNEDARAMNRRTEFIILDPPSNQ